MFDALGFFGNFYVQIAIACMACYALEKFRPITGNQKFFKKEMEQDLTLLAFNVGILIPLVSISIFPIITKGISYISDYQMFSDIIRSWPLWVQVPLGVLIVDLIIYWRHRFTHYYMWRFHAVHHNAQEISWTTKFPPASG